ncbi:rRNA maturation RNase YbeY [Fulvivirga ligni]|uniref:rRNA maturation RNase YbeY n=1 Tax=Fulvivirga ligni TaxID=2904246 RepID=UPI001F26E0FE|nr:rRNA maturation RNase YbeY [Fulvivirga ligni]UII22342.1 rRNA maturation RNase YbeY [Fulvivirga ligni]
MAIHFFEEEVNYKLPDSEHTILWIENSIKAEGYSLEELNFIFCSDEYLHQMNVEYLDHDTLTDIITFDNSEEDTIEGDIFISIDRVKENASDQNTSFDNELHRVLIHGVLHLCGYGDKEAEEKKLMREKEDTYLSKL